MGKPWVRPTSYKYCMVPSCTNTTITAPDKYFFYVPKDPKIRKQWCRLMNRNIKIPLSDKSTLYCCESHFNLEADAENYIRYKLVGGRMTLKSGVVPHIFRCQTRTKHSKPRSVLEKLCRKEIISTLLDETESPIEFVSCNNDSSNDSEDMSSKEIQRMDLSQVPVDIKQEFDEVPDENSLDHPEYIGIKLENEYLDSTLSTNANEEEVKIESQDIKLETPVYEGNFVTCDTIKNEIDTSEGETHTLVFMSTGNTSSSSAAFQDDVVKIEENHEYVDAMLLSGESNAKTEPASSTHASQGSSFQTSFAQYLNKHELKDSEEKIDYGFILCIYCKAKFKSDTGLDNHIVRKHPEFMATVTRRIHECKMCSFKTTIVSHLEYHQLKHPETASNFKLSVCVHCSEPFKSAAALDNHIIKKHPEFICTITRKIHECQKCHFKTIKSSDFTYHQLKHTETAGNYNFKICAHCHSMFRRKSALENHIIKKHKHFISSITSKIYECTRCPFKTTMLNNYNRHVWIHR